MNVKQGGVKSTYTCWQTLHESKDCQHLKQGSWTASWELMMGQFCFQRPLLCRKPPNNLTEKSGHSHCAYAQELLNYWHKWCLWSQQATVCTAEKDHHSGKVVLDTLKCLLCCDAARSEDTSYTRAAFFHRVGFSFLLWDFLFIYTTILCLFVMKLNTEMPKPSVLP